MKSLLAKILIPNGAVLGVVEVTNLEHWLKCALIAASIIYTVLHCAWIWKKLHKD